MIPYLPQPHFSIFGFKIYAFGICAALALIIGHHVSIKKTISYHLDPTITDHAIKIMLPIAIILSYVFSTLWYYPETLTSDTWYKLSTWSSMSSFGGFLGAALGFAIYFSRKNKPRFIEYADSLTFGFVIAWFFTRLGCALAHDHPGIATNFFLAVNYPVGIFDGVARHNIGLYLAIFWLLLFILINLFFKNNHKQGRVFATLCIIYPIVRFFLDFLRAYDLPNSDARYYYLTPAQWGCFVLLGIGIYYYRYSLRSDTPVMRAK